MKSTALLVTVAFGAIALAGCVEDPAARTKEMEGHSHEAPVAIDDSLRIEAKDCVQAGGNSVYAQSSAVPGSWPTNVGPFKAADQRPEVGDPMIGAFGVPVTGPADGIWHTTAICKSYTYMGKEYSDFQMGFIAQMIERPDFDTWGEPRIQFMVADLSFNVEPLVDALGMATGGAEISPGKGNLVEWTIPDKYMHVIISEANHGTFDFSAEIHKEFAKKESEHIRFWMLPRTDGMGHSHGDDGADEAAVQYRPISIDVFDTATGGGVKLAGESAGTFLHIQGDNPAEWHEGNPLGHYWDGFDRTIVIGPAPEGITYDRTWLH